MSGDLRKTLEREKRALLFVTIPLLVASVLVLTFLLSSSLREAERLFVGDEALYLAKLSVLLILLISWILVIAFFLWIRHWEKRLSQALKKEAARQSVPFTSLWPVTLRISGLLLQYHRSNKISIPCTAHTPRTLFFTNRFTGVARSCSPVPSPLHPVHR